MVLELTAQNSIMVSEIYFIKAGQIATCINWREDSLLL